MTTITTPAELGDASGFGVKLTATLPKDNGLRPWARLLAQQPREQRYAVVLIDTARVIDDLDADTDTAVIRILRVEVMSGVLVDQAAELMLQAANGRGADPLLFDSEAE